MDITIKINTDNAAFADDNAGIEVARILRRLAYKLENEFLNECEFECKLMDVNGNSVGTVITEKA